MPRLLLPPTQPLSSTLPCPSPAQGLCSQCLPPGKRSNPQQPSCPSMGRATLGVCYFRLCGLCSACGPAGGPAPYPRKEGATQGYYLNFPITALMPQRDRPLLSCPLATGERRPSSPQTWSSPTVTGSWVLVQERPGYCHCPLSPSLDTRAGLGSRRWQWLLLASMQVPSSRCVPGLRSTEKAIVDWATLASLNLGPQTWAG